MKIGMIGLGAMGLPIAKCLLNAGYELHAFDVAEKARQEIGKEGAVVHSDAGEIGLMSDIIVSSLPNAVIVDSVITEVIKRKELKTEIWIDLSSISPKSAVSFARRLEEKGISYMDCPVSGGVQGAASGTLTVMAGGPDDTYERSKDILEVIGEKIYHVGGVGSGSGIKMVNNFMLGCNMAAAAEAIVLGCKLGINLDTIYEIVSNSSGRSFIIDKKIPNFVKKRNFDGGFAIDLQYKDLGLALETAKELAMPVHMGSTAAQIFETARAKGYGRNDITALVKMEEELMNVEVK